MNGLSPPAEVGKISPYLVGNYILLVVKSIDRTGELV